MKLSWFYFLTLIAVSFAAEVQAQNFSETLVQRIEASTTALQNTETSVNSEKRAYAERLTKAEEQVRQLRAKANGIQREADERLLSLQKLQDRLKQWKDQQNYQNHLLERHLDTISQTSLEPVNRESSATAILDYAFARLDAQLSPRWVTSPVALPSGEFVQAQTVRLGPAQWFYAADHNISGLYEIVPGQHLESYYSFTGGEHKQLQQLLSAGYANAVFDPTQGRAIEIARHQESFLSHLEKGGVWVLPILFFGSLAFIIAIAKAIQLVKLPRLPTMTLRKVEKLLDNKDPSARERAIKLMGDRGPAYQRVLAIVLQNKPSSRRDELLMSHVAEQRRRVDKYLDVIALTAAVAPLLGLLGTVSGMIKTFKMLTIFGSGDPAAVSGGISEALVTTELGLIVAIPALVVNAFLSRKAKSYMHDLEEAAITLGSRSHNEASRNASS